MIIKTRFSPSPTGFLHVGGMRTALYSWLFARSKGGKFILRIEDTDLKRSISSSVNTIINSMKWLNINWDEGPYFQSQRFNRYRDILNDMISKGNAYKCFCTKERLKTLRLKQINIGKKPRYDGYCRNRNDQFTKYKDKSYVVRFCNPKKGSVVFNDLIRGNIEFANQELDDLIICRADGTPTYNFCVVVDDLDMGITHVIRGEDHINNTPRQINILKSLGAQLPEYAHISMILGEDGKKLSKRHSAISIMQYRDDGFLPEALLNYLVRLGWSYKDQEIFSIDEMIQLFSLKAINKSPSIFDSKKLLWFNQHYINNLPNKYIAKHLIWHMKQQKIDVCNGPKLENLVILLSNRCSTLKEMANNSHYFYQERIEFDINIFKKYLTSAAKAPLKEVRDQLILLNEWTISMISAVIKQIVKKLNLSMDKIGMPLRVAITGKERSPEIYATIHAIGKSRCLARINMAINFIESYEY